MIDLFITTFTFFLALVRFVCVPVERFKKYSTVRINRVIKEKALRAFVFQYFLNIDKDRTSRRINTEWCGCNIIISTGQVHLLMKLF